MNRLKNYIPISAENFALHIDNENVYVLFRFNGQVPLHGDDALKFYKSLLEIYKNHLIFLDDEELKLIENGEQRIKQTCDYLDMWKDTTLSLDEYVNIRKHKYLDKLDTIEDLIYSYKNSRSINDHDTNLQRN